MNHTVIVSEEKMATRVQELAEQISADYNGKELVVVCFVNGASIFYADLIRRLTVDIQVHFLGFSSYNPAPTSGEVKITLDVAESFEGKHVLLIEGVVVSGRTPKFLFESFKLRKPASIEYCAIGIKPKSISVDLPVKYYGFEFEPDQMVAGYGIGKGKEKALPYLVAL